MLAHAIVKEGSGNDPEIGRIIAEAIDKVGKDGVITIEESKGVETMVEVVEGMAVRLRLYLPVHDHGRRQDGSGY